MHNKVKATIATENVMQVRIHRLDLEGEFEQVCQISPPFLKHISLVRFSPSGRHLLIGNESGQYFYIYELWPSTEQRFNQSRGFCAQPSATLRFTLFRGFRPALISDCQFLAHGSSEPTTETVVINSLNGTTHVFRLNMVDTDKPANDTAYPVQNLVAACTFKHHQIISSMVSGGKRLLNQISSGLAYQPQGEMRLVSHVFSGKKGVATVMTYTSKNELVTFDVVLNPNHAASSNRQHLMVNDSDANSAEERAMIDMVLRSGA